ncbi:MAG: hypothetical protein NC087_05135 [Anaeroplasma bactoclasticum]|nr:hypothetical protein [Anaeroplasma bactoclasticum]
MNEMKYDITRRVTILDQGKIGIHRYAILSLGTHPVAYVEIPSNHPVFKKHYSDIEIEVHGGLTYGGDAYWIEDDGSFWIGWDYAHVGDYTSLCYNSPDSKKWTTSEIYDDVLSVIKQLETKQ